MITEQQRNKLVAAAIDARTQAYAAYSDYQVGAALLCADGTIVSGCNVENASYGLTMCAERVALFTAVAQGQREFSAIGIATENGALPCGACLQVLAEFCQELPILIISAKKPEEARSTSLSQLLPSRFGPADCS